MHPDLKTIHKREEKIRYLRQKIAEQEENGTKKKKGEEDKNTNDPLRSDGRADSEDLSIEFASGKRIRAEAMADHLDYPGNGAFV
ncbi:unnamed protein product [Cyprideis torosa]|uniref:Uncharacterized protein n=1 Tax=Cyprideis torosa TaxID=163714 RepID=A0A7R8WAP6_9CRUS|nr:unnamed protein product [Cyprideis torosa]CAG0888621.1 unnamed protein product [Cyprideis torosa]